MGSLTRLTRAPALEVEVEVEPRERASGSVGRSEQRSLGILAMAARAEGRGLRISRALGLGARVGIFRHIPSSILHLLQSFIFYP